MRDGPMAAGGTRMDEGIIRCPWAERSAIECAYHDRVWGVPLRDERALFGMLCLEGMQAGLSWSTILRKMGEESEYKEKFANPYQAASRGYIDDVIEPRNTRFRIIRAFQSLQNKKVTNPLKKHDNIPL